MDVSCLITIKLVKDPLNKYFWVSTERPTAPPFIMSLDMLNKSASSLFIITPFEGEENFISVISGILFFAFISKIFFFKLRAS
jgi:hypothetical protein